MAKFESFDFQRRDWNPDERDWRNEFNMIVLANYSEFEFELLSMQAEMLDWMDWL